MPSRQTVDLWGEDIPVTRLCGWGVWKSPDEFDHDATRYLVREQFKLWSRDEARAILYKKLHVVGAAPYKPGQRSMLWELGRKLLGTDPLNYPQQVGDCFIGGTKVTMGDGSEKSIEDVLPGQYVLSHTNVSRRVLRVIKKKYTGDLCTLKIKGYARTITATPDHRFVHLPSETAWRFRFSGYDWKAAGDLSSGDRVLMPFGLTEEYPEVVSSWGYTQSTDNIEFGRLIGLYLAEGGLSYRKQTRTPVRVDFSLNKDEVLLAEEIITYLDRLFGVSAKIVRMPSKPNVIIVRANNTRFAWFIKRLIPGNVYSKCVPDCFFRSSRATRLALIRGWMDGDGHLPPQGSFQTVGVTASSALLYDMHRLALSCKLRPKSCHRKKASHQRVAAGSMHLYGEECVAVYPDLDDERQLSLRNITIDRTPYGVAAKIGKVTRQYYEDVDVYCLEVEEDHSFQANGVAVHNCVSFGCKNAIEYLQFFPLANGERSEWTMVFPPYLWGMGRLAPDCGNNRLGTEDGSVGAWQARAAMEYGSIPLKYEGVPEYSGEVARRWGNKPGPGQKWIDLGKQHIVKSAAAVLTWEDLVQAITNGYPVTVASGAGFEMLPRADGFHHRAADWGHQTCLIGVDDDPSDPYVIDLNSWGPDVHGILKDFKTGATLPGGVLRIRKADIMDMLAEQDSFAYSSSSMFPAQDIDRDKFNLW